MSRQLRHPVTVLSSNFLCGPVQPSTLPQGTVNMNLCTDVIDAEPKTGQKNSLCIVTPEQEYFIRGENKEIINGYDACWRSHIWTDTDLRTCLSVNLSVCLSVSRWSEQLVVYPRTNKQNQKKKRKVEPTTSQVSPLPPWSSSCAAAQVCLVLTGSALLSVSRNQDLPRWP